VTQVPSTISINGMQTQSATVGQAFGSLAVTLKDAAGVVIKNYSSVTFTATAGANGQSGTFNSNGKGTVSIPTNGTGVADPLTFTANTTAGAYTVGVTAGSATATFNLTNNAGLPASISASSGGGQQAVVNTAFTLPLQATVLDAYSNPVPSASVTFTAPASGASATFSGTNPASTNAQGVASITAIANGIAGGPYNVTATVGSFHTTFSLTNKALTVQVTVGTNPSGLSFSVDGETYTTAQTQTWIVGSKHTIATTTPQRFTGVSYESPVWSDGGAISHTVTASVGTTSYTVTFDVYYALTIAASPAAGGTVIPALGGFFPAGSTVSIQASPKSGYTFKNWTGPVANASKASTKVTMTAPETVTANFAKK